MKILKFVTFGLLLSCESARAKDAQLPFDTAVSSSNERSDLTPEKTIDGETWTRWASAFVDGQWLLLDFGTEAKLSSLQLNWENAYGLIYNIQVSSVGTPQDNSVWTTIYAETQGRRGIIDYSFPDGPTGRYIRIECIKRGTRYGFSLYEVTAFGTLDFSPSASPSYSPTGLPSASPSNSPTKSASPTITAPHETLQEAIIKDMMPPSSSRCRNQPRYGSTKTTFSFESSQAESNWWKDASDFEHALFLAKMEHEDINSNRTWTLSFGTGGNIYSFVGPMGETVPTQEHENAPWIEDVWQSVSTDTLQNTINSKFFLHESGVYQRDLGYTSSEGIPLKDVPFYSPSLGSYCHDHSGECGFSSWAQQSHVPTKFTSGMANFNRYKDCGNGVIEYTTLHHNNVDNAYHADYHNIPWGNIRRSALSDLVITDKYGNPDVVDPMPGWGEVTTVPVNQTAGYAVFAEDLESKNHLSPFINDNIYSGFGLTIESTWDGDGCQLDPEDPNVIKCRIIATSRELGLVPNLEREESETFLFRGTGTGIKGTEGFGEFRGKVKHWSYMRSFLYLWPEDGVDLTKVREVLPAGSTVQMYHWDPSTKRPQDNLGLAHVYGVDAFHSAEGGASTTEWGTRLRYGNGPRDNLVYTINSGVDMAPGDTYSYRQYFMVDSYDGLLKTAKQFVSETQQTAYSVDDGAGPPGRVITLYSTSDSSFGAVISGNNSGCDGGTSVCTGSTTPKGNSKVLYQITCGTSVAVTDDPYRFSPDTDGTKRPYICHGMPTERPSYSILGFFPMATCAEIANGFSYDPNACGM